MWNMEAARRLATEPDPRGRTPPLGALPMSQLERDGQAIAYVEAGSGPPPLVFVHGFGGSSAAFAPQLEYFRRDHRVVAIDLPGHGASGPERGAPSIGSFADDLAWLCGELGLYRPVVVGHSMGGQVALELA